jgi:hypothetical protein
MSFFAPTSPILCSKPLECKFVINKINWLSLSTFVLMKKSKILTSIPQNLVIYHIKNLCYHIDDTLFYLWLRYGAIWTNIVSHVQSFSIKLCNETWFLSHVSKYLKTCFNHPNHKKSSPF